MGSIQISLEEVRQTAASIKKTNHQLEEQLLGMKKEMNQLSGHWKSPAGDVLVKKFNKLQTVFTSYKKVISQYALFLDAVAQGYGTVESNISRGADQF